MGQRVLPAAFGAEAVLGRRGRGAPGLSSARPEVLDAEAEVGASLIKAAAGAGGRAPSARLRASEGFDAGGRSWESRVWRPGAR